MAADTITCTKCGESKSREGYYPSRLAKNCRTCIACDKARSKRYLLGNEEAKARMAAWRRRNRDKMNAYKRKYYLANKDKVHDKGRRRWRSEAGWKTYRSRHLRQMYGITTEQYEQMIISQDNKCGICFNEFTEESKPNIDHCHATKRVRGLLCAACNRGLGLFRDDPARLSNALEFLNPTVWPVVQ